MAKSEKYSEAVIRARGESESTEMVLESELPAGMLVDSSLARASIADKIKSGEWEAAPQLLSLKKGQTLIAILEGNGPEAEFEDRETGVCSSTNTWVLSKDGVRVSILDTVQLSKKLPPYVGGLVSITRGEDKRAGTRIYTDYLVVGPKRADGQPRQWSQKQLPDGERK